MESTAYQTVAVAVAVAVAVGSAYQTDADTRGPTEPRRCLVLRYLALHYPVLLRSLRRWALETAMARGEVLLCLTLSMSMDSCLLASLLKGQV